MKISVRLCFVLSALLAGCMLSQARADVTLPKVIASHMVVQRDRPLSIWGWASPDEEVTVKFDDATASAKADADGNWKVELPAMKADGKTHSMTVTGKNKIELEDILIGDVWIGSGQSNMEFHLGSSIGAAEVKAAANYPQIRLLHVSKVRAAKPAKDVAVEGASKEYPSWKVCTPKTCDDTAAVLFYFGRRLNKDLDVPVGLISSSWGGSPIREWDISEQPHQMYNGMIAPLASFAIRGVLWYQGEADEHDGLKYAPKMKQLVEGWRKVWGYDFPFYFVEIAPFSGYPAGTLPHLWEAQIATLKVPGTGIAATTDVVENLRDIHPRDKLDVGNRLALWALAKVYGKDVVYSGPIYKSMKIADGKAVISFAHVGAGLKSRNDKPLSDFEIAGADGKFVPAEAKIEGTTVVVESKKVASPAEVRFAWNNLANPNLVNSADLPALAFQTKDWQGGTGE